VVVKLLNNELAHENRAGAVYLNLRSPEDVEAAVDAIRHSVALFDPSLDTNQFLIETMVEDARAEFLVGVKRQIGLGLALVVGSGGTEVDSLRDYRTLLLPSSDQQIHEALSKLALTQRMNLKDATMSSMLSAVRSIVRFAEQHSARLVELDVNPLILRESGDTVAVDALMRMSSS